MSPSRSRRSASHAAGTHGWLPQKTGRPGIRRGEVGGYNLHILSSSLASTNSNNKRKSCRIATLRTATGCTQDTNIQHLHDETLILPIHKHIQLHASQFKQKTQYPSHTLHKHTTYVNTPRLKHYLQQCPLRNTHSPRPPHSHYNRHKNKDVPYTYIYCL